MLDLLNELGEWVAVLWATSDRYIRWGLVLIFSTIILIAAAGVSGSETLAAIAMLLPVFGTILLFAGGVSPTAVVVAGAAAGTNVVRWLATLLGGIMLFGLYMYFVPVNADPILVVPLVVAILAFLFFAYGAKFKGRGPLVVSILGVVAVITGIFFLGGRDRARAAVGNLPSTLSGGTSAAQPAAGLNGTPTLTVDGSWRREFLARDSCFAIATDRNLRVRKDDGEEFQWDTMGRIRPIVNGQPGNVVPDVGEYIPNSRLSLRSEDGRPAHVDLQVWPRPNGKTCT